MIGSFRHKGLKRFYQSGSKQGIRPEHAQRLADILARLDASTCPEDMNLPGLQLHSLHGDMQGYYAVSVSGPWRVIFHFENTQAMDVDYVQYH